MSEVISTIMQKHYDVIDFKPVTDYLYGEEGISEIAGWNAVGTKHTEDGDQYDTYFLTQKEFSEFLSKKMSNLKALSVPCAGVVIPLKKPDTSEDVEVNG